MKVKGVNVSKRTQRDPKGFTLMEVVIAVGLLATVSVVSVSIVANLLRSTVKSQAGVDIEQTSNFVLLKIKNDLGKAVSVTVSADTLELEIDQGPSLGIVRYSILSSSGCVSTRVNGCIKRNNTYLTDSTDSASAVSVEPTESGFFVVNNAVGEPIAVNIVMKFKKPSISGPVWGSFSGESILNTTIALPTIQ